MANKTMLNEIAFARLEKLIAEPPKPTQALVDLMTRPRRYVMRENKPKLELVKK